MFYLVSERSEDERPRYKRAPLAMAAMVEAEVDDGRRQAVGAHHSATHLLHWALEEVLGDHVKQEGSLVKEDLLRFDFRHFAPLAAEEIVAIEGKVARAVLEDSEISTTLMALPDAVVSGAKAFFDEKYDEDVRVVAMGNGRSRELCGGTHVARTGQVGLLKILKQEAVSSGIRRIYAVCHEAYVRNAEERERRHAELASLLKVSPDNVESRVRKLLEQNSALEKEVEKLEQKLLSGEAGADGGQEIFEAGAIKGAVALLDDGEVGRVRTMADMLRDRIQTGVVMVGASSGGKLMFVIASTQGLPATLHCGKMVGELAALVGGRGGGKPDFGQAGGGDPTKWEAAARQFKQWVETGGSNH